MLLQSLRNCVSHQNWNIKSEQKRQKISLQFIRSFRNQPHRLNKCFQTVSVMMLILQQVQILCWKNIKSCPKTRAEEKKIRVCSLKKAILSCHSVLWQSTWGISVSKSFEKSGSVTRFCCSKITSTLWLRRPHQHQMVAKMAVLTWLQ